MRGVGIIGTGRHGSRYVHNIINDIEGLELKAIARRSQEGAEQAASWGVFWYRDWQDLITDPSVEAVIAVVPPALNPAIARSCAREGKPLLMEKPLGRNSLEAAEIVTVMNAASTPLTVGQTLRYNPVIRSLRSRIAEMGALYSFSANQRLEPSSLAWHDERETAGAGVLIHTAIHVFDALCFITGLKVEFPQKIITTWRSRDEGYKPVAHILQSHSKDVPEILPAGLKRDSNFGHTTISAAPAGSSPEKWH